MSIKELEKVLFSDPKIDKLNRDGRYGAADAELWIRCAKIGAQFMAERLGQDFSNNPDDPAEHCFKLAKELS